MTDDEIVSAFRENMLLGGPRGLTRSNRQGVEWRVGVENIREVDEWVTTHGGRILWGTTPRLSGLDVGTGGPLRVEREPYREAIYEIPSRFYE
jgi:hypothetical protein